jgi:hypothetical protein
VLDGEAVLMNPDNTYFVRLDTAKHADAQVRNLYPVG